jgi:large subunit ribosomal protein L29
MPRLKTNVQELTVPEAEDKVLELKKELFNLRFRNAMRQLDNPLQIRFLRKDLARLKTALAEHQQGIRSLATGEMGTTDAKTTAVGKTKKASRAAGKKKE